MKLKEGINKELKYLNVSDNVVEHISTKILGRINDHLQDNLEGILTKFYKSHDLRHAIILQVIKGLYEV